MACAAAAISFATKQSIWTDEATQLCGLSLHLIDQWKWLAGLTPHRFTVPPDRMPPLSYWIGSLWASLFGGGEWAARSLSLALSVASVVAIYFTARAHLTQGVGLVAALLVGLSPNFIVEAAEIRAYALLILCTILVVGSYLRLVERRPPSTRDLWAFALSMALCSYAHYFGLVVSAAAVACLTITYARADAPFRVFRETALPAAFLVISVAGLIPFVLAAVDLSRSSSPALPATSMAAEHLHDLMRLGYRLFAHQSMLGIRPLAALCCAAGYTLLLLAATPGATPCAKALLGLLLVALLMIVTAGFATAGFNAFAPTYNVWLLPVVALIASAAPLHQNRHLRALGIGCVAILLSAEGFGALRLATSGEIYAHTRSSILRTAIERAGVDHAAVIYINDAPSLYFAMSYYFDDHLQQYIAVENNERLLGHPVNSLTRLCEPAADTLLLAADAQLPAESLERLARHPDEHSPALSQLRRYLEVHSRALALHWHIVSLSEHPSQSALALAVFTRDPSDHVALASRCIT